MPIRSQYPFSATQGSSQHSVPDVPIQTVPMATPSSPNGSPIPRAYLEMIRGLGALGPTIGQVPIDTGPSEDTQNLNVGRLDRALAR